MKTYLHNIAHAILPAWIDAPIIQTRERTIYDSLADRLKEIDEQRIRAMVTAQEAEAEYQRLCNLYDALQLFYRRETTDSTNGPNSN